MTRVPARSSRAQRPAFGFGVPSRGRFARGEVAARLARAAERLRYEWITVADHVVLPVDNSAPYPYDRSGRFPGGAQQDYLEPLALTTWLLAMTRRVRVGISVLVVPYRNPVVTAKQLATIDVLARGRLIVGCGVGWWPEEFAAVAAPPFAERGAVTDEYIRLMKALWAGTASGFVGKYYRLGDVTMLPAPAQRPHPPIWIGGHSDPAIRRAAALGDAWHPIGLRGDAGLTPAELAPRAGRLRELAARAGRAPDAVRVVFRAALDVWPSRRATVGAEPPPLVGPPSKVVDDIRAYQRAGVDDFVFDFTTPDVRAMVATMHRFARDVRPRIGTGRHAGPLR